MARPALLYTLSALLGLLGAGLYAMGYMAAFSDGRPQYAWTADAATMVAGAVLAGTACLMATMVALRPAPAPR
jgi:predicted ABC-type sugar transport system permease subunit